MTNPWGEIAARAQVALSASQVDQLQQYLDRLLLANQTMNLTRIDSRAEAEWLHIADSLTVLPFLPPPSDSAPAQVPETVLPAPAKRTRSAAGGRHRIADIGSGGGLPGIPIAIARPDLRLTLIEATRKKAAFLE
ncbi:MAG: RsmG family class I SAM-dependent methyltransferase, partial [Phycisphaerales bacterium]|nr:RsmG family class I SAM-dependent methyltransferase [Phycisphaerales bacterium]